MQTVSCKQEMRIQLKMATFFFTDCPIFQNQYGEAIDEMDKLCKFHENPTKIVDLIAQQRNANFQLTMVTFLLLIVRSFFKINRVEAIDEMDKMCKFYKNQTKNADFIA